MSKGKRESDANQNNNAKVVNESLASKSIEDIMADGFSRQMATAIYESEHKINMCEPISVEEFIAELERMKKGD